MLDYGFRSKCCLAPIKMSFKKVKNTNLRKPIWTCTKCLARDIHIVPKNGEEIQQKEDFA